MTRQCIYITGTDTDVGKTVAIASLARALQRKGKQVLLIKAVQTGCQRKENGNLEAPDICVYQDAVPRVDTRVCVMFESACSPHLARELDNNNDNGTASCSTSFSLLSANALANAIAKEIHASKADIILIEGAGGLLTPLNDTETLADVWAILANLLANLFTSASNLSASNLSDSITKDSFTCSTLLVVANKLGAINHALLSCEIAKNRGLAMHGFIMTQTKTPTNDKTKRKLEANIFTDNTRCIARMSKLPCLASLSYCPLLHHNEPAMRQKAWKILTDELEPVTRLYCNQIPWQKIE